MVLTASRANAFIGHCEDSFLDTFRFPEASIWEAPDIKSYDSGMHSFSSSTSPPTLFDDSDITGVSIIKNVSKEMQTGVRVDIAVPSSDHVAEIVGKNGERIKRVRSETRTYIKTPQRGENPVFVISGQPEDVRHAIEYISESANQISRARALRKATVDPQLQSIQNIAGVVTKLYPVDQRLVGLIVGKNGGTIKQIQEETNTYIVTPSKVDAVTPTKAYFHIQGLPSNVDVAMKRITDHVELRLGHLSTSYSHGTHTAPFSHVDPRVAAKMNESLEKSYFSIFSNSQSSQVPSSTSNVWSTDENLKPWTPPKFESDTTEDFSNVDRNEITLKEVLDFQNQHFYPQMPFSGPSLDDLQSHSIFEPNFSHFRYPEDSNSLYSDSLLTSTSVFSLSSSLPGSRSGRKLTGRLDSSSGQCSDCSSSPAAPSSPNSGPTSSILQSGGASDTLDQLTSSLFGLGI